MDGWKYLPMQLPRILFDQEMNREMTITEILNTGLAFMGWLFIMVQTGKWFTSVVLKSWDKHRKSSRRQKAVDELYDAFELQSIEPGTTVRLATKGALTIMMFALRKLPNDKPQRRLLRMPFKFSNRKSDDRMAGNDTPAWQRVVRQEETQRCTEPLEKSCEVSLMNLNKHSEQSLWFSLPGQ
jgi:hypothetical protein